MNEPATSPAYVLTAVAGPGGLTFEVSADATPEQLAELAAYSLGEMVGRCENPAQAFELMAKITQIGATPEPAIDAESVEIPIDSPIALDHTYSGPGRREDNGEIEQIAGAFAVVALAGEGAVLDNGEGGRWSIDRAGLPNLAVAVPADPN